MSSPSLLLSTTKRAPPSSVYPCCHFPSISSSLPSFSRPSSECHFHPRRAASKLSGRSDELQPPPTASRRALRLEEQIPSVNLEKPPPWSRAHAIFFGSGRIRFLRHRFFSDDSLFNSFRWEHLWACLYLILSFTCAFLLPRSPPSRTTTRRPSSPWTAHSGHPPPSSITPTCSRYLTGAHARPIFPLYFSRPSSPFRLHGRPPRRHSASRAAPRPPLASLAL